MSSGKTVTLNTGHKIPYVQCAIAPCRQFMNMADKSEPTVNWDTAPGKPPLERLAMASMRP